MRGILSSGTSEALRESEQHHETLFEQAPVGIFLYDRDFRIIDFNARFVAILRSSPDRLRGLDMRTLRDSRILPTLERALRGEVGRHEGPYEVTNGDAPIVISLAASPLSDGAGAIIGAMGLVDDITERHQAEHALVASEARFRALVENAPDAIAVHPSDDAHLVYANQAWASLLGYDVPADVIGLAMDERIHPDDRAQLAKRRARLAAARGPVSPLEYRVVRRDGSATPVEIVPRTIEYDGRPHTVLFARDLSGRKHLQARLLLADRMVSTGTLAAGVAHEINNPLAYVMTNLDLVATRRLPAVIDRLRALGGEAAAIGDEVARVVAMIDVAREGSERMRDIVRDLRTLTRGAADEARAPVDVRHVLDASINLVWNEIRHRARLVKEYAEVPPVVANEARLGQVFLNLLVNAAQALPVGGAADNTLRVRVSADRTGHVTIEVSDTGPGIPPAILDRIFDPFFTTKPVGVGTGLGLWICQGIVTSLGGHIAAESQPGEGATFRVVLPSSPAVELSRAPADPAPVPPEHSGRLRLLVVDDEIALGRTLAIALSDEFEVATATSGRDALQVLGEGDRFDVVLCDLMMPDVSGMDVYERIVAQRPHLASRFVFVTGGAFTDRARAFVDRVPAPVMEKPFQLSKLPELLRAAAGQT